MANPEIIRLEVRGSKKIYQTLYNLLLTHAILPIAHVLSQIVLNGKFHNKEASIHILPEGSSDILKEKFSNQSRLMM